jgi:hypothetical protein
MRMHGTCRTYIYIYIYTGLEMLDRESGNSAPSSANIKNVCG